MRFNKPIDMPRSTHYGSNFYTVYSRKNNRVMNFYSNLEYYNYLNLEANSNVKSYCEQPYKIDFVQDGKLKHAIFDTWVEYWDGTSEFQEVKYSRELSGDDPVSLRSIEQIRREEAWCEENNIKFVIRTEKELEKGPFYIQNLNAIVARFRRYIPSESEFYNPRIINALDLNGPLFIEDLVKNKLLPINNEMNHICYLYCKGIIDMNIQDKLLDYKAKVILCTIK